MSGNTNFQSPLPADPMHLLKISSNSVIWSFALFADQVPYLLILVILETGGAKVHRLQVRLKGDTVVLSLRSSKMLIYVYHKMANIFLN